MSKRVNLGAAAAILWLTNAGSHAQVRPNDAVAGLEASFMDVAGIKTRYYEAGQGEPVILVHGGGFAGYYSANVWSKNIPGLGKRFRVFAPDKLAAGMTENPLDEKRYDIFGEIEHIYQFIQTLKLGKVHLVGQSRGAGLALMLAMKYPEVVRTLVLVDSGTASPEIGPSMHSILLEKCPQDPDARWKCEMKILSRRPDLAWDEEYFAAGVYMGNLPKSQATVARLAGRAAEGAEFSEWKKRLHERLRSEPVLPMPVLLYWGANDPQATVQHAMALYDVLADQHPAVRLMFANEAGHFHFREYPDEFNHNVISFIDFWQAQSSVPLPKPSAWTTIRATAQPSTPDAVPGLEPKSVSVSALGGAIRTRYYEVGQGEPMVLAHGGGFAGYYSANIWAPVLPGLGRRFHVFAPDKLMAGMTDNPPDDKDYNIQGEVEHMYRFIQTLTPGKVHLVGQSRGAGLALVLAVQHPEVVRTLILIDSQTAAPDFGVGPATRSLLLAPCPQDRTENWRCEMKVLSFKPEVAFPDESFAPGVYMGTLPKSQTTIAKVASGAGNPQRWDEDKKRLHERLQHETLLPFPVLLYWGYNDPQATRERGLALYNLLATHHPMVRMLWVNKAGHFHWREYPDEFVHNVTRFVEYWRPREGSAAIASQ